MDPDDSASIQHASAAEKHQPGVYNEIKDMIRQFLVIIPIVFLSAFGGAPFDQIRDQIVYTKLGGNITSSLNATLACQALNGSAKSEQDTAQSHATMFKLYMSVGSCVAGIISMPFWMGWSDSIGRQVGLIAAVLGNFIKATSLLSVVVFPTAPLWILIVGDTVLGMLGKGNAMVFAAAASHIADVTPPGKRTLLMLALEFTFLCSAALGNVGTGYWIKASGFVPVLLACMSMHAIAVIYTVLIFERYAKQKHDVTSASCMSSALRYITSTWTTFTRRRPNRPYVRRLLLILESMLFIYYCGFLGTYSVINLYTLGYPLCWGSTLIGINNGVLVASSGVFPLLFGLMFFKHGPTPWLVLIGLLCGMCGCLVMGFSTVTWMMLVGVTLFAVRALVSGTGRSIVADIVDEHEVGKSSV